MIETHQPRTSVDNLAALLRSELERTARGASTMAGRLDEMDTLLRAAETKARPRTELPQQLHRFPFTRFAFLRNLVLKGLKFLFQDQRAVNAVLIQALREQVAVNRYLLERLEKTPHLRIVHPGEGGDA